jgi:hypothetical protein
MKVGEGPEGCNLGLAGGIGLGLWRDGAEDVPVAPPSPRLDASLHVAP